MNNLHIPNLGAVKVAHRSTEMFDDTSGVRRMTATLPRGTKRTAEVMDAVAKEMSYRCHCSHDCCACEFAWASVIRNHKTRRLSITQHFGINI